MKPIWLSIDNRDVAYLSLGSEPRQNLIKTTRSVTIPGQRGDFEILVDIDEDDRIVGFEFDQASTQLPKSCL